MSDKPIIEKRRNIAPFLNAPFVPKAVICDCLLGQIGHSTFSERQVKLVKSLGAIMGRATTSTLL
jgi:hypothetical protein